MTDHDIAGDLHDEMAGWTIESVQPTLQTEGLAEFHLSREGSPGPVERKVVVVCATDLGAWIADSYDPSRPYERDRAAKGQSLDRLLGEIHDYLIDHELWGGWVPEEDRDRTPEEIKAALHPIEEAEDGGRIGFKSSQPLRIWWLSEIQLADSRVATREARTVLASRIVTRFQCDWGLDDAAHAALNQERVETWKDLADEVFKP